MQVLCAVLGGNRNEVTAGVALGVLGVDSGSGMQWLVDISDIVDEEAESVGLALLFRQGGEFLLHGRVDERALVVGSGAGQPVDDVGDGLLDVVLLEHEARIVTDGATLVEIRGVHEVPAGLPGAAAGLDLVGEGRALSEGVVALQVSHRRVAGAVHFEQLDGLVEGGLSGLGESELVLGNASHEEVAVLPKGGGLAHEEGDHQSRHQKSASHLLNMVSIIYYNLMRSKVDPGTDTK